MKNTWSEAKFSVALLVSHLSSNKFLSTFSLCVCLSLSFCASVFSVCLFSTHTDTVFQTAPSSQTSNPTLFSARIKEKKKYTHFHLNIHQQQPHKTPTKKEKKRKTQKHKHSDAQTDGDKTQTWTHARTHASQTHSTYWQTNTQRNSKHKAQHSQKSTLCRNILKCVLQYN